MPSAAKPRRSQEERRGATRVALLDATLACLVELGYARTSTTEVARTAGVSQGAIFKHFATKSALMAAATESLFDTLIVRFGEAFARDAEGDEPVVVAIRRLWDVFCHPSLRAVYSLFAEAAADDDLRSTLGPVVERHSKRLLSLAESLFPEIATSPAHRALFEAVLFAMQGATLQRPVYVDTARERAMLESFETAARALFPTTHSPPNHPPTPAPAREVRT